MIGIALMASAAAANPCATGQPINTTVAAIASAPELYVGRCVVVTAWSDGATVFANKRAIRRYMAMRWRRLPEEDSDRMIGVYGLPELADDLQYQENITGLRWRIIGRVDTCGNLFDRSLREMEREREREPQTDPDSLTIVIVPGHCHFWSGPVIVVQEAQLRS